MKIRWLIILIFIAGVRLFAQGLQDWKTITYMNDVTDMKLLEGKIWVSTSGGVYHFSPEDSSLEVFTNIEGLGSLDLTSIETDRYNTIITSSRDGLLNRYYPDVGLWTIYNNLKGEEIVDLHAHEDTLWVATNRGVGVFIIDSDNLEFRDFYNNFPQLTKKASRVAVFNKKIYYATNGGLLQAPSNFVRNNLKISEAWKILTVNDGLPSNDINDIVPTTDTLFIATTMGAAKINLNDEITVITSWTNGAVSLIRISDSKLYFVQDKKYYERSGSSWIFQNQVEREITAALFDKSSNFWVAMNRNGIKKDSWSSSYLIDGPASNYIGSVIKSKNGELWISSGKFKVPRGFGFYKYDFNQWTNYFFYDGDWYRKNNVVTVYEDLSGKIWYGSWGGGISYIDGDNIDFYHGWSGDGSMEISTTINKNEFIAEDPGDDRRSCFAPVDVGLDNYLVIPYFLEDDLGNLWSTNHGANTGAYVTVIPRDINGNLSLDCNNWIYFGRNIGMTSDEGQVSTLEFDDFGRVWIATFSSGIMVFDYNGTVENRSDDKSIIRVNTNSYPSLFSNTVLAVKKDQDGIMWIGTAGGLNSFDGQNFFKHVGEIGPIENKINAIFVDHYNNKWFATDGGMSILKADESPWDPSAWIHYTPENSGLPHKTVNSIFVDQTVGEAYIGTESGLSIFKGSFSEIKEEMNSIVSGPSPYILDGQTDFVIKNLVFGATVKILNVNGKLVRILTQEEGDVEGGRATWDGRDQSQAKVASGIYIFLVYNEKGITASGKIAVIKP